jgi:hypothetical protein
VGAGGFCWQPIRNLAVGILNQDGEGFPNETPQRVFAQTQGETARVISMCAAGKECERSRRQEGSLLG